MEKTYQKRLGWGDIQFASFQLVNWKSFVLTCGLSAVIMAIGVGCGPSTSTRSRSSNPKIQLWVADTKNNRVLGYQAPPKNGGPASVVLGQPTFGPTDCNTGTLSGRTVCGPLSAAIDVDGSLWIADTGNNRVLKFDAPFQNGQESSLVIGQFSLLASGSCAPDRRSLCGPRSLAFDRAGNLWVADTSNNRVLEFVAPFSSGMSASVVLGQPNFTDSACGEVSSLVVCSPSGLAFDTKGDLFISDKQNSRVIMFQSPFRTGMAAVLAIGQLSVVSNSRFLTTQFSLSSPSGIALDKSDNLYVADSDNSRIMIFAPPNTSGENASVVLGNANFTSINPNACGPINGVGPSISGGTLCHPLDVKLDGAGNVVVADQNDRTLIFEPPITTGEFATVVLGQLSLTLHLPSTGLATSQNDPGGLAVSGTLLMP